MKKKILIGLLLIAQTTIAQQVVKTMFYNVLNYPSAPPENREVHLKTIIDDYQPDLFMVCELETAAGGEEILNASLNATAEVYASAPFLSNASNSAVEIQQLLYYNKKKFTLVNSQRLLNSLRDINWYTLRLNTENPIQIEVFVCHLKASQGTSNENRRLEMVDVFLDNQVNLDPDAYVLFAGDFNLYTSNEEAYRALVHDNNSIIMVDPIDALGDWHNDSSFDDIHTQSTRISNDDFDDFGSGGGLDDRFDFIFMSENFRGGNRLSYIPDSYVSYGNNKNCYNRRIDDVNCTGEFSQEIRDALYMMSDHLPVVMEFEADETLSNEEFFAQEQAVYLSKTVVDDFLRVHNDTSKNIPILFKVYNTLGQELISFDSEAASITDVPVYDLPNGLYYLKSNLNINALKFVVQH
ncbi:hypothetical protein [Aquimarina rhabdastrellae]